MSSSCAPAHVPFAFRLPFLGAGLTTLLFLSFMAEASAQSVTRVYPRFVVAGQEAHFTAEGINLPVLTSEALGMKFAVDKPAACTRGQRDKPTTPVGYFFSCQFQPGVKSAKLRVFHRPSAKVSVKLWDGTLQVLDDEPKITSLLLLSQLEDGQTRVACQGAQACIVVIGKPLSGKPLTVEVTGSNLPHTLTVDGLSCQSGALKPDLAETSLLRFQCLGPSSGEHALMVLTAPRGEGGQALLVGRIDVPASPDSP